MESGGKRSRRWWPRSRRSKRTSRPATDAIGGAIVGRLAACATRNLGHRFGLDDGRWKFGFAPTLDPVREPVDVAISVLNRTLRPVPTQPTPLVAVKHQRLRHVVGRCLCKAFAKILVQ